MKKRLLISLLSVLGIGGCTLDDALDRGIDCPPRMFAYDIDADGDAYLCMLGGTSEDGVSECIPCDFGMNRITDGNNVYLAKDNHDNYIYKNRDENETDENRKYLDEDSKDYIINKYSDYINYVENHDRLELYAISGLCTKNDLKRYDECNSACGDDVSSCADDECKDVIERANKCFKLDNYQKFFDGNFCPSAYPICSFGQYDETGVNFYCDASLKANCSPKTVDSDCGLKISHWVSGQCIDNTCIVEECSDNYQPAKDYKSCVADCLPGQHYDNGSQACVEDDIFNCGMTGYICSETVADWLDGWCEAGVCTLSKCQTGYKVVDNTCKSDCLSGEHYDSAQAKCVKDDLNNCGATGRVCKDEIKNSSVVTCDDGKCNVSECNTGYTVSNNTCSSNCTDTQYYDSDATTCKPSSETDCGMKGYSCSEKVAQWASGSCQNNVCTLSACKDGYKVVDNACKPDCNSNQHYNTALAKCEDNDINNCGAVGYSCSERIAQWAKGACVSGVCSLSECESGYKIVNNTCKSDCKTGEHYDSEQAKCVTDDIDNCGATGHICKDEIKNSTDVHCTDGKCYVDSCNSGYSVNNNTCTSSCTNTQYYDSATGICSDSNTDNCGQKGYKCSDKVALWSEGICSNNVCTLSVCQSGYKVVSNICKPDCGSEQHYNTSTAQCEDNDINNCGAVGYKCSERVAQWVEGSCVSGICTLSACESGYKVVDNTCKSDCKAGEHYDSEQAKCVGDDTDNCGATGHACADEIKNSKTVSCDEGKCHVSACNPGYNVTNNVCTSSCSNSEYYDSTTGSCATSDVNNCGQKGYKCSAHISNWDSGNCTNNACMLGACKDGYAIINNECKADCGTTKFYDSATGTCVESDVNNCGQKGYKCSAQISNWVSGACSSNVCLITECAPGYKPSNDNKQCVSNCTTGQHYDSSQAKCVEDDDDNCGATGRICKDEIKNSSQVKCESGKCIVTACNSGYTVNNNACASSCSTSQYYDSSTGMCATSDTENCGQKDYKCAEHASNWLTGECKNNACVIKTCNDGYAVVNNECKADCGSTKYYDSTTGACVASDVNNCGQKDYKCASQVSNWSKGTCSNNVCILTECSTGYKPSTDFKQCVSDCKTGQHYDSAQALCVDDDLNNCGSTGHACKDEIKNSKTVKCNEGKCSVTECNSGYTVNNNVCTSSCSSSQYYDSSTGACATSDISNCGQKDYKCSEHISNWKGGSCTSNACFVSECLDGYSAVNNECKANCGTTKYYDSTTGTCVTSDINNCGQKNYKCSAQVSNWEEGVCSDNICTVSVCAKGYKPSNDSKQCVSNCTTGQHYDSAQTKCVNDDENNCGATGHKCLDEIKNSKTVRCEAGKCFVSQCNAGYNVINNVCTSSCSSTTQYYDSSTGACAMSNVDNCGQKGYKCSSHVPNWSDGNCTNNACIVTACANDYSPINGECKADCGTTKYYDSSTGNCVDSDKDNCGQKGYKCAAQISNWSDGICSSNVCYVNKCDTGYKPSSDNKQCVSDCTSGQHYDSNAGKCVADDNDNCGATGHACKDEIKNSKTVHCSSGRCYVDTCNTGYSVSNNVCVSSCTSSQYYDSDLGACKDSDINNCGQKHYRCSEHISNWNTGNCTNNACLVSKCNEGYTIINKECKADCGDTKYYDSQTGACVASDVNNCGQKGYKCSVQVSNWSAGSCTNNVCSVTKCETGYKPSTDGKSCVSDCSNKEYYDSSAAKCKTSDVNNCGQKDYICADHILNWKTGKCTNNACDVESCNAGYSVNNNVCTSSCSNTQYYDSSTGTCAPSNVSNCGQKGYNCASHIANWKSGYCTENACVLSTCNDGYIAIGNECKANCGTTQYYDSSKGNCVDSDIDNCGQKEYKCAAQISNWSDGDCSENVCIVTKCAKGYKPSNDKKQCVSDCSVGEHYDSSNAKCVPDDINNCGATGHSCYDEIKNSNSVHCSSGKCYVDSCNTGYTVNNNVCTSSCSKTQYYNSTTGTCVSSDINNCGQQGYICSAHIPNWKTGTCTENACVVKTCIDDYTVINNECKADCGKTKYYDSSKGICMDSDKDNCGQKEYKCAAHISNWSDGKCTNNVCIVTKCDTGYKPSSDGKQCVSDCSTGQHYDSSQSKCVSDDVNNCGATGHSCKDEIKNSKTVNCSAGKCNVTACNSGYTVHNNVCTSSCTNTQYYDSNTGSCTNSNDYNCGQAGYSCFDTVGWYKGGCINNQCIAEACDTDYHVFKSKCVADTIKCCGDGCEDCYSKGQACIEGRCNALCSSKEVQCKDSCLLKDKLETWYNVIPGSEPDCKCLDGCSNLNDDWDDGCEYCKE
ncbi:MAG: hypothetical protein IJU23_01970 [Proteobacteria bacterium]|nr:hypothetical protein [Pseudomonadota bacterium]